MESSMLLQALESVSIACERVRELRTRRIGERTPSKLTEDITLLNRAIAASGDHGPLLAQKALLLNHDQLLNEFGNLQNVLKNAKECMADVHVQHALHHSGHAVDKVFLAMQEQEKQLEAAHTAVLEHEHLLSKALGGAVVSSLALNAVESRIIGHDVWTERVLAAAQATLGRIREHGSQDERNLHRMAASLVLAVASGTAENL
jgi:hypothetical protein